eukprot:629553-Pelagomonas_calceolata.AAC.1
MAIQRVISTQPKFAGLNTYVGVNGSTIYLSYGDRRDALNPQKKDTPAFKYPVWEHFEYDPLINMGNRSINYKKVTNLESTSIEANIARSFQFLLAFVEKKTTICKMQQTTQAL